MAQRTHAGRLLPATHMIFLSKDGQDEYINMFARGCGVEPTDLETWTLRSSGTTNTIYSIKFFNNTINHISDI